MRSIHILAIGLLALGAVAGCHGGTTEPAPATCQPACPSGQTCEAGTCHAPDAGTTTGSTCMADADCPANLPVCSAETHTCTAASDNSCKIDGDCKTGVCSSSTHMCVASDCATACQAWEVCSGRECKVLAGHCNADTDCNASTPICDMTHTCVAPAVTPASSFPVTALIVTSKALSPAFQQLATLHTLTGVATQLVTVEDICAAAPHGCNDADPCNDTAKVIKDYLIAQQANGIQQVLIGGGIDAVPSRSTADAYSNTLYATDISETFYTDYYYADLSNWDTNGNCVYGEPDADSPMYLPSLGVTRIAASSTDEVQTYMTKAVAYLTAYDTTRINTALFVSNVAAQVQVPSFVPFIGGETHDVDAAAYFEAPGRTLSFMPEDFDITKLYSVLPWPNAMQLTIPAETTELERGYNLVVHMGHGGEQDLTVEQDGSLDYTGDMAYQLQNTQFPIMVSCACEAATFADGNHCAGEQFIMNPQGGGIGYLGNSTIGLGPAGGAQFVDQFVKYTFSNPTPLIGEAVMAAHNGLPTTDSVDLSALGLPSDTPIPAIDANSYRWTQKATTFLGDGLLPIWTDPTVTTAPSFTVLVQKKGSFTALTLTPSTAVEGTLSVAVGQNVYRFALQDKSSVSVTVAGAPNQAAYGFASMSTLMGYGEVTLQ